MLPDRYRSESTTGHRSPRSGRLLMLLASTVAFGACAPWSEPLYVAEGSFWIQVDADPGRTADERVLESSRWTNLLRSYEVLEQVAIDEGLASDAAAPRDAARELNARLRTELDPSGRFMRVSIEDADRERARALLDAVMERQVEVGVALKRQKTEEELIWVRTRIEELRQDLAASELELEEFRAAAANVAPDRSMQLRTEERRLTRHVFRTESLVEQLRARQDAIEFRLRNTIPDVRVLDRATVSRKQPEPTPPPLAILLALFGALVGSAVLAIRADRRSGASTPWRWSGDLTSVAAIVLGGVIAVVVTFFLG